MDWYETQIVLTTQPESPIRRLRIGLRRVRGNDRRDLWQIPKVERGSLCRQLGESILAKNCPALGDGLIHDQVVERPQADVEALLDSG